jgi:hypothetical protein
VTFDPLGDAGDFPADPDTIRTYGEDVAATGQLIELQVVQLRALADGDSWVADSADAFRDKAEELAGQISRSSDRHVAVGEELKVLATTWRTTSVALRRRRAARGTRSASSLRTPRRRQSRVPTAVLPS